MIAEAFVGFYRLWHGTLRLKGAGYAVHRAASLLNGLQSYRLRLPEGQFVTVDFRDVSAFSWVNTLLGDSPSELALIYALSNFIRPESVVWDVGANCGVFSYLLAKEVRFTRAHFFEPNPRMFQIAASALAPFAFIGHNFALSESRRNASFVIPEGGSTVATLEPERTKRSGETINIECKVADELVASGELPPPSIVKIDTEGHELAVLSGMSEIVDRFRPVVFFEHLSLSDSEVKRCVPPNYRLYLVRDRDGSLLADFDRTQGHNSALVPAEMNSSALLSTD